ncbi:MAG: threonine--tRNA ligase [Alcanivorax borkumensis]|jgi:threonyl-tRNA synthetase|uniref:Threonine--tRNA ligase n=1 Tax=Alcanivorax borkumensis (strain ATCC 700651 / DSM 11573 / NCIMB 13689 / SK2) TaxID=393595 RepID=Q0VML7_ALCBS|nr:MULTISPECIES: threonine--tRNA ligase [Alcanivorax]OJH08242.1 MAG: threonine--tRNA ligase [Alcanivorax borkumensis]CAL17581.1 Threonyl-tRNA synthetase [Alcanivorax borkumensis SK2]
MSVSYQLPDGANMEFEQPVSALEIAGRISKKLAKQALAAKANGNLIDVYLPIDDGATVEIITRDTDEALELIRHDAAHVMAQAVQELFPDTQVTIGPTIANGFYYDFHRDIPFTPDDLKTIEKRMLEIVRRNEEIRREIWDRDEAVAFFLEKGEEFKAEIIRDLPADQEVSLYRQGDFIDLCRGPHLPSTSKLGDGFKLTKVAGAYWRGDADKAQLQRIYGTAWRDKKELNAYLKQLEEAEKRDHRKLAKEMGLFHIQQEAVGSMFWHPKGWRMRKNLENYIRGKMEKGGYEEVSTPQMMDRILWEQSGHWDKYGEDMFTVCTHDHKEMAVKPMNCPGHVQIFKQGITSYRDLPIRLGEFTTLFRNEAHGALHGLMRARSFSQDDAHIFCTEEQVNEETAGFIKMLREVYADFGFDSFRIKFSDRPDNRAGSDETWDKAEGALRSAVESLGLECELNPGEGAFYGPKLEFVLRDAIGRDWQCGTLQVDFVLPDRLDAEYVAEDGSRQRPVMLHRAVLGSLERFLGILIESTAGHLPLWLAPRPVAVCTITNSADEYATTVQQKLVAAGIPAELDIRNEKIGFKVREHSRAKTPRIWVIGEQEAQHNQVAIRTLGSQATETVDLDEAVAALAEATRLPI